MARPRRQTFFLEQAEFLGGAERFSLDFFNILTATEKRLLNLTIVGAEHPEYRSQVPSNIAIAPLKFPSVSGNVLQKFIAVFRLFWRAKDLQKLTNKAFKPQWVTNTPRGHFLLFLAKTCWGLPGLWIPIFHDFTTKPPWLLRMIAQKADILIANSIPTRAYLRSVLQEKDYQKICIIENGINFAEVPPCTSPTSLTNILHLGRIDPRKGQLDTAKVAHTLKHKDLNFSLVGTSVVQDPRTITYEAQIKDYCATHQLTNIHFKGEVSDPFAEIAKYDALLVLSTEPETFGRIAIEGLSCNKLVIAYDQTGPREILTGYYQWLLRKNYLPKNQPNLLLVPANDAKALTERLVYFLDNPKTVGLYTNHAREFAESNFSLQETKKRLVDVMSR